VKFELQFFVRIDSQSSLPAFTHRVVQRAMTETFPSALASLIPSEYTLDASAYPGNPGWCDALVEWLQGQSGHLRSGCRLF